MDQSPSDVPTGTTLVEAGKQIAGLISVTPEEPKPREQPPKTPKTPKEEVTPKQPEPKEDGEEEVEVPEEGAEPQTPKEGEDDGEDDGTPAVRKFKVKADGQDLEVDEPELIKGYSRTADYTRKTQALAERIKEFEAKEIAPVRAERQEYTERLTALSDAVKSLMPEKEPNWEELRNRVTPDEYARIHSEWTTQTQRLGFIEAERKRVRDLQIADAEKQYQGRLDIEKTKLAEALPEWADPTTGPDTQKNLKTYAETLGFTPEDLGSVSDHRLIVMLHKARLYDDIQKNKPKIEDKIDKAMESIQPRGKRTERKETDLVKAQRQLAKTGRVEDAAALFTHLVKD